MENDSISFDQWEGYLEELYNWINEKYALLQQNDITNFEYQDHLDYYNKEKKRIEDIIEEIKSAPAQSEDNKDDNKQTRFELSQKRFEDFFGVSLDEDSDEESDPEHAVPAETADLLQSTTPLATVTTQDDNGNTDQQQPLSQETPASEPDNSWELVSDPSPVRTASVIDEGTIQKGDAISANILLIGDSSVGRTSIRRAWMGKHFVESHLTTIGASIEKKVIEIDGNTFNVTMTDLGGQDFYSGLRKNFYRNVDGAIIVFDLTRQDTFRRVEFWVKEFYSESRKLVPFLLVGNKYDKKGRIIEKEQAEAVANRYSQSTLPKFRVRYLETSAKSGKGVNEVFEMICREIRSFKVQNQRR